MGLKNADAIARAGVGSILVGAGARPSQSWGREQLAGSGTALQPLLKACSLITVACGINCAQRAGYCRRLAEGWKMIAPTNGLDPVWLASSAPARLPCCQQMGAKNERISRVDRRTSAAHTMHTRTVPGGRLQQHYWAACMLRAAKHQTPQRPKTWPKRPVQFIVPFGPGAGAVYWGTAPGPHARCRRAGGIWVKRVIENRPGGAVWWQSQAVLKRNDDHVLCSRRAAISGDPSSREVALYARRPGTDRAVSNDAHSRLGGRGSDKIKHVGIVDAARAATGISTPRVRDSPN